MFFAPSGPVAEPALAAVRDALTCAEEALGIERLLLRNELRTTGLEFGRPTVARSGISTGALVRRIYAGETVEALAWDYGLEIAQIEDAILFEGPEPNPPLGPREIANPRLGRLQLRDWHHVSPKEKFFR